MRYAIIGAGAIGTALATQFARKRVDVVIANSRGPASLDDLAPPLGFHLQAVRGEAGRPEPHQARGWRMTALLSDTVVVVTGAASGIGRAIAVAAAHHGARAVVVSDVTPTPREGGSSTTSEIETVGVRARFQ